MNVLASGYADWEARRQVISDGIRSLSPDVVALQEVVRDDERDEVTELLGTGWNVVGHPSSAADGTGAALAGRWPMTDAQSRDLQVTQRTATTPWCGVVAVEVSAPQPLGPVLLVHHKPSWPYGYEYERERQAVAAARLVEEITADRNLHVVLLGDFDAAPDSESVRFWTGRQSLGGMSVCYQDAWDSVSSDECGHTFSPRNPLVRQGDMPLENGRRIDYIMVRCGDHGPSLRVAACRRVFTGPVGGIQASDHYGVVADLALPPHTPGRWAEAQGITAAEHNGGGRAGRPVRDEEVIGSGTVTPSRHRLGRPAC
ncbi:endonuclease/exonuclease/phosphatase family protein [Streptomyces luteogriseus]|nr:endonuclease/exonuclease/phosphatase family protein [Streptomyces luteogriseus]